MLRDEIKKHIRNRIKQQMEHGKVEMQTLKPGEKQ